MAEYAQRNIKMEPAYDGKFGDLNDMLSAGYTKSGKDNPISKYLSDRDNLRKNALVVFGD